MIRPLFRLTLILLVLCRFTAADGLTWKQGDGFRAAEVRPEGTGKIGFTLMDPKTTSVLFTNTFAGDAPLTNAVGINGSGVALGDVDGDGWVDIYFCNLQGPNRLYRNLGGWRFEPMEIGPAACEKQLSTGATFADVDGDGDLDLLVNGIAAGTRLFLNDGKGHWTESTNSGLSRTASATSMALADIDGDGDLDLYCTHYVDEMHLADPTVAFGLKRVGNDYVITSVNGQPTTSSRLTNRFQVFGNGRARELPEYDGLYRNDGKGHFTPILFQPGEFSDATGNPIPPYRDWGLAVMFRDLNGDGAPDIYVANDNASPDRMWLNNGNGTFRAFDPLAFRHTSRSSMGIDMADLDRDGYDDIFVVDMLARNHAKRMTELVKDFSDPSLREQITEQPRYNRNALFFGRRDGTYAEAALMAGVAASDWSWCPLFLDVDLDGYEDLLITSGFMADVMDQDSHNYLRKTKLPREQLKRSRQFHPKWATPKAAFRNLHDRRFVETTQEWGLGEIAISHGAALADLDNDGDLDLVINNFNSVATLYRNDGSAPRLAIRLKGAPPNTGGIGARIEVSGGPVKQTQEMISGGRYLSGGEEIRVFAASVSIPMQVDVRWRNGQRSRITNASANHIYEMDQAKAAAEPSRPARPETNTLFTDLSASLNHKHTEDSFDDWTRQPLLPHRLSRFGPAACWFDFDGDGWEDLVIGAARGGKLILFRNDEGKRFIAKEAPDKAVADQGAIAAIRDSTGVRLFMAISNLERGLTNLSELAIVDPATLKITQSLGVDKATIGPIAFADIDGDGDLDLFVGGRFIPGHYPEPASSFIYLNDHGQFAVDGALSQPFIQLGMVSGATFTDLDGDGAPDLALALEWGGIRLFHNEGGKFKEITDQMGLTGWTGLWTSIATGDFDGDGRMDLVAGNWGRNTAYELYEPATLRIYHGDWNGDGIIDLVEAWQHGADFLPVRDRTRLSSALPDLATRFPSHTAYAQATIDKILGDRLPTAHYLEAAHLESVVLLNRGSKFEVRPLPGEAQLSPATSICIADFDLDGIEDLFLSQNFYGVLTDVTRDDNGRGLLLRGVGDGTFLPMDGSVSGIKIPGEQRAAVPADFNHDGRPDLVVTQNDNATKLYLNQSTAKGLRVVLHGPPDNPCGIGAQLRLKYADGHLGPTRMTGVGSSQSTSTQSFALSGTPSRLMIRWSGGAEQVAVRSPGGAEIQVSYDPLKSR
jgi:hypothetical protein